MPETEVPGTPAGKRKGIWGNNGPSRPLSNPSFMVGRSHEGQVVMSGTSGAPMASRVHQPLENEEFDFILARTDALVLAYFCGSWPKAAKACKEMDPIVREMADTYQDRLIVVKADMARCPAPTKRYGVTRAPSFLLIKDGAVTATEDGPMTQAQFKEFLDANL
jgi:thioredoxin 1